MPCWKPPSGCSNHLAVSFVAATFLPSLLAFQLREYCPQLPCEQLVGFAGNRVICPAITAVFEIAEYCFVGVVQGVNWTFSKALCTRNFQTAPDKRTIFQRVPNHNAVRSDSIDFGKPIKPLGVCLVRFVYRGVGPRLCLFDAFGQSHHPPKKRCDERVSVLRMTLRHSPSFTVA